MIINKIANTTAAIDIINIDEDGEEVEGTSVIKELLLKPNEEQIYQDLIVELEEALLSCGNAYLLHIAGIGAGNELRTLNPKQLDLECTAKGVLIRYRYIDAYGVTYYYEPEEVLHIKTSNIVNVGSSDVMQGLSPLQAMWVIVQSSSEKFKAGASIFKNRGIIGILTNKSDAPMLKKERDRLQSEFDSEAGGADKFNKIKISTTDLSYIQTGMSPSDLKLLEGVMADLRLLCAAYGMPSILFNDNEKSTYNNVSEAKITAYSDVYVPLGNKILRSITSFLNERLNVQERIVLDLTSIDEIRASTNRLLQTINSMDNRVAQKFLEVLTIDELRALGNLEGINNDELVSTLNQTNETNTEANQDNQGQEN
jgi:HK97 family phage portal protein